MTSRLLSLVGVTLLLLSYLPSTQSVSPPRPPATEELSKEPSWTVLDSTTDLPSLSPSDVPSLQPSISPSILPLVAPITLQPSISPSILPLVAPITVAIDVLGQSGKFTVFDEELGNNDPNLVTVTLDFLYEIGADGVSKVGNTGNPKHSIQTFANQDFSIDDPIDTMLGSEVNGLVDPVGAQLISFHSSINGIGLITIDTYIIKSGGTIVTDDGESWDIQTNDIKFNIVLSDWTFCDPCGNGNNQASSEFIDVAVEIKGRGGAPEPQGGLFYDLGGDVPLLLSNRVNVDGEWVEMPDGYPSVESQGNKNLFVFRFPKFSDKAIYDPIIGLSVLNTTQSPTNVSGLEEPTFAPSPTISTAAPVTLPTSGLEEPTFAPSPTISTAAPVTLPTPRPTDASNAVVRAVNNGLCVVWTVVVWWLIA